MTEPNLMEAAWEDCPSGKISALASRLNTRPRRSPVRWSYVATLAVLSGILAVRLGEASHSEMERIARIGYISCSEVLSRVDDHIRGNIQGELRSQIGFHLSNCPNCARQVRGMGKKEFFGGLFGTASLARNDAPSAVQPFKRSWCDDPEPASTAPGRSPVVAQKVLAAADD